MEPRRTNTRNLGLLLALSTPVSAFVAYAFVAVLIGEDRLENADGTTALGYLVMAMPLVLGLAIAGWAHFGGPLPRTSVAAATLGIVAVALVITGITSVITSADDGDASIGGVFLVVAGLVGLVGVATAIAAARRPVVAPPPPPLTE